MTRSLFLLISGIYSALLSLTMLFFAKSALESYGAPTNDLSHISTMQFLGVANIGFAVLALLNRNAPNSVALRNSLLATAIVVFGGVLKGMYDVFVLHPPMNGFFIGDTVFRLLLGLGLVYFYNRETKLAQVGAVMA